MPELPEVETIRRALQPVLVGAKIESITLLDPTIAGHTSIAVLQSVTGQRVDAVGRRGKHLILYLEGQRGIILHLRMTGALLLQAPAQHARIRAIFSFSNGRKLFFNDMRRLGTLRVTDDVATLMQQMGPEPLEDEFTARVLADRLSRRRMPIKAALLDQHVIAGIGNMYADEALFHSHINPLMPAGALLPGQYQQLRDAIRDVLQRAVENHGASVSTYWLPDGAKGSAHEAFCVAHKLGAPCPRCGTPVARIMVRERGAYFCPECQPFPPPAVR
jgi:formamidopyrimidine-DNA glycosylase